MSYIALYRKKRPKEFDGVIGQEHIIKTLKNQIKSKRINHAYLFCGTRGTGKTSTAKIFAKAVNCQSPKDGQPCGECYMCTEIENQSLMNVIEIDAASNNGVDNIRDIREEVKYPPTEGKYKVYIIDEVHMLSIGAFNALLKTLEEPPEHVVFILATTDPQKIPVTILSRCQRFDFRRISEKEIADTIKKYMPEENVDIDDDAVEYIARVSDGAMRDALSILDQSISFYYGEKITLEKVLITVGAADDKVYFELAEAVFEGNSAKCMKIIYSAFEKGVDVNRFAEDFLEHLRNVLIAASVEDAGKVINLSSEKIGIIKEQAKKVKKRRLINIVSEFSEVSGRLKYSQTPRVVFEVSCIKLCEIDLYEKDKEYDIYEKKDYNNTINVKKENYTQIKKPIPMPIDEEFKKLIVKWKSIAENFKNLDRAVILQAEPKALNGKFYIVFPSDSHINMFGRIKDEFIMILEKKYGFKFDFNIVLEDEYKKVSSGFDMSEQEKEEKSIKSDMGEVINTNIFWDE